MLRLHSCRYLVLPYEDDTVLDWAIVMLQKRGVRVFQSGDFQFLLDLLNYSHDGISRGTNYVTAYGQKLYQMAQRKVGLGVPMCAFGSHKSSL